MSDSFEEVLRQELAFVRDLELGLQREDEEAVKSPQHFRAFLSKQYSAGDILAGPEEVVSNWRGLIGMYWDMARKLGRRIPPPLPQINWEGDAKSAIDQLIAWTDGLEKGAEQGEPTRLSLDAQALGVFIERPDWTKKQIADRLGCHEKSLTPKRCPKLALAMAAYKAKIDPGTTCGDAARLGALLKLWNRDFLEIRGSLRDSDGATADPEPEG